MALTNNLHLAEKMYQLRSHGITRDESLMECPAEGMWYYQQVDLGFNYRMSDIQAALGLSQLQRLDRYVLTRNSYAQFYTNSLVGECLSHPIVSDDCLSAFHLYSIQLDFEMLGASRNDFMAELLRSGVATQVHYIPLYEQKYFKKDYLNKESFPCAHKYYSKALSLPLFPKMSVNDVDHIVSTINQLINS